MDQIRKWALAAVALAVGLAIGWLANSWLADRFHLVRTDSSFVAFRINTRTGETWRSYQPDAGQPIWVKVAEPDD